MGVLSIEEAQTEGDLARVETATRGIADADARVGALSMAHEGESSPEFAEANRYTWSVARGWESKSVENQIDLAERESTSKETGRNADKLESDRQRKLLELSRTRVQQQLENAQNERYREQLNRALADLDKQIAKLAPKE